MHSQARASRLVKYVRQRLVEGRMHVVDWRCVCVRRLEVCVCVCVCVCVDWSCVCVRECNGI